MLNRTPILLPLAILIACGDKSSDTVESETDTTSEETEGEEEASVDFQEGVSTLAGSGEYDSVDGVGSEAVFGEPKVVSRVKMVFLLLEIQN